MPDTNANDITTNNPKEKNSLFNISIGLFFFAIFFPILIYILNKFLNIRFSLIRELGTVGDFFGGSMGPILNAASFLILLSTYLQQQKELALTRKEYTLSRKQFEQQTDVFERQKVEMAEQSGIMKLQHELLLRQQKENKFMTIFNLFKEFYSLSSKAKNTFIAIISSISDSHREDKLDSYSKHRVSGIISSDLCTPTQSYNFFCLLIQFINNESFPELKKMFADIMRATCSEFMLIEFYIYSRKDKTVSELDYTNIFNFDCQYFESLFIQCGV